MDLVLSASSCAPIPYCCLLVQPFLALGRISRCLQPQLFVNGTFNIGSCLDMTLALLDLSPMSATASGILLAAQLWVPAYFGIQKLWLLSMPLILIRPCLPFFRLVCSLWVLDIGWKFPYIVRNLQVFTSTAANAPVSLKNGTRNVLMVWNSFLTLT